MHNDGRMTAEEWIVKISESQKWQNGAKKKNKNIFESLEYGDLAKRRKKWNDGLPVRRLTLITCGAEGTYMYNI